MKKLFAALKRNPKRYAALLVLFAAIVVPAALFAYGPSDRTTYTTGQSPIPVTFNSITNNPTVGDERNFVRIKEAGDSNIYGKTVALQSGTTYEVEVFYNNDSTEGSATGTTARIQMPTTLNAGDTASITGFINAANSTPSSVWDTATATTTSPVVLSYVAGSAKVLSAGAINGSTLPDSLFTTGTNLGYNSFDGVVPQNCNGYITFEFTVAPQGFTVQKQVSVDGGTTWASTASTTPGSTVLYRIIYTNTGAAQQDNVTVSDTLPAGETYVKGSTVVANTSTNWKYESDLDTVTTTGINEGSYQANGGDFYLKYSAQIATNDQLSACGTNTLTNVAHVATSIGTGNSSATVTVNKTCTTPGCVTTSTNSCSTPPELPHTGPSETIAAFLGLGALVTSIVYYVTSRRKVNA